MNIKINDLYGYCEEIATILGVSVNDKFTFDLGDERSMESLRSTFQGIDKFIKPELGQYCVALTSPELESQLLFIFPETQEGKLDVICFDTATTDYVDVTEGLGTEENPLTLTSFTELLSDDNVIQKFNDFVYGENDELNQMDDEDEIDDVEDDAETEIAPVTIPPEGEAPAEEPAPAPAAEEPAPVEGGEEEAPVMEDNDIVTIDEETPVDVLDAVSVLGEDGEPVDAPAPQAPAPDPAAAPAPQAPAPADPATVAAPQAAPAPVDPMAADPNAVADPFAAQDPAMVADPMPQAPADPMAAQAPADPNMAAPAPAPVDPAMVAPADPNAVAPAPAAPAPDPNADMAAAVAAAPDPAADPNAAPVMEEDGDDTTSEWFVLPNDDEATSTEYNVTDDETMLEGVDDQSVPDGFEPISEENEDGMVTITADGADDFVAEADNVEIEINNDDDLVTINADPAALNEADEEVPAAPADPVGDAEAADVAVADDPATAAAAPVDAPAAPAPAAAPEAPVEPAPVDAAPAAPEAAPVMDEDPTTKMKELLNYYTDYLTKLTQDPNPDIDLISATQAMIASLVKNLENVKALEETKEDAQEQAEKQARKDAKEPPKAGEEAVNESQEDDVDWIRSQFGDKAAEAAQAFASEGRFTIAQIAGTDPDTDLCDKAWDKFCNWCIKGKFDGKPFDPMENMESNGKEIVKSLGRGTRLPEGALDECGATNECGNKADMVTLECDKPGAPVGKADDEQEIIAGECGATNECGNGSRCDANLTAECGVTESADDGSHLIKTIPLGDSTKVISIYEGESKLDGGAMRGRFYIAVEDGTQTTYDSRDEGEYFDTVEDAEIASDEIVEDYEIDGLDTVMEADGDFDLDDYLDNLSDDDYKDLQFKAVDKLRKIDVEVTPGEALEYLREMMGADFEGWVKDNSGSVHECGRGQICEADEASGIGNDKEVDSKDLFADAGKDGWKLSIAQAKNGRYYFIVIDNNGKAKLNSKDNGDLYDKVEDAIDAYGNYDYDEKKVFGESEDDAIDAELASIRPAELPELGPDGLPLAPVLTPAEEIKADNFDDIEVEDEPLGPELGADGLPLGSVNDMAIDNDIDAWHDEMIPMGLDADYSDDTPCASNGCCSFDDKPTFGRGMSKVCWSDDFLDTLAPTSCDNTETIPSAIRELGFYVDRLMTCVEDEVSKSKLRKAKSLLNTVFTTIQSVNGALDGKCLNTDACLTDVERLERGAAAPLSHIANVEEVEFGDDVEAERLAEASIAQWCKTWKHLM